MRNKFSFLIFILGLQLVSIVAIGQTIIASRATGSASDCWPFTSDGVTSPSGSWGFPVVSPAWLPLGGSTTVIGTGQTSTYNNKKYDVVRQQSYTTFSNFNIAAYKGVKLEVEYRNTEGPGAGEGLNGPGWETSDSAIILPSIGTVTTPIGQSIATNTKFPLVYGGANPISEVTIADALNANNFNFRIKADFNRVDEIICFRNVKLTVAAGRDIKIQGGGSSNLCIGNSITFNTDPSIIAAGYQFQWYYNGAAIIGATQASYTLVANNSNQSGNYAVAYIATLATHSTCFNSVPTVKSDPIILNVLAGAGAPISTNQVRCGAGKLTFNITPAVFAGNVTQVEIFENPGIAPTATTVPMATLSSSPYVYTTAMLLGGDSTVVWMRTKNAAGGGLCATNWVPFTAKAIAKTQAQILGFGDTITVCVDNKLALTGNRGGEASTQYKWIRLGGAGNFDTTQVSLSAYNFGLPTTFKVVFSHISTVCGITSDTLIVKVVGQSKLTSSKDFRVVANVATKYNATISNSAAPVSYKWVFNSKIMADTTANPIFTTDTNGIAIVKLINGGGCVSYDTVKVNLIENLLIPSIITVNADGFNDYWHIKGLTQFPNAKATIINRWGREVYSGNPETNQWPNAAQVSDMGAGTYFYHLELDSNTTYRGIITVMK